MTLKDTVMAKKYKEQYYDLDEEEMQSLLNKAKAGDTKASTELLKIFDNFLSKYVTMLYYNKYNLADYDLRRFIALWVKNPYHRKMLMRNAMNSEAYQHISEIMNRLTGMAQRYGTEEDVRQTVVMTFLQCVERYKRRGDIPFKGFLFNYFYFMVKKNVDLFLQDQLGRKTFPLLVEEDDTDSEDSDVQGFYAPPVDDTDNLIGPETIDEYWVVGDTALFPFDLLTVQERQLLKWRYVDKMKSSEISKRITEHPNTVREHFNRIKTKIGDLIQGQEDLFL